MTLANVDPGDAFTVRTIKRYNEQRWANVLELVYVGANSMTMPVTTLTDVLNLIADTEADLLLDPFTVERVLLSTVEPDGRPYNPFTFISLAVELQGRRSVPIGQRPLPLTNCVLVKKTVSTGRQGNILMRGLLHTGDGTLGIAGFTMTQQVADTIENRLNQLRDTLIGQFTLTTCLATVRPDGTLLPPRLTGPFEVRRITTTKKLNNKYFDKGNSSQGGGSGDGN